MAPFTGLDIFPGVSVLGEINEQVRELVTVFDFKSQDAFQKVPPRIVAWAEAICTSTTAAFRGKLVVDFTALNGFEPFNEDRTFKQVDLLATTIDVKAWQRNVAWSSRLDDAGQAAGLASVGNQSANVIEHARRHRARVIATVLMQGTDTKYYPGSGKAKTYEQPGFATGIPLFSSTDTTNASTYGGHFVNPMDDASSRFPNYFPGAGKFDPGSFAATRANMQLVPSPTGDAETTGYQVTDIIGASHMEEPFRQVSLANLYMQVQTVGTSAVGAAASNVYSAGSTPCTFWTAPQLNSDPYLVAFRAKFLIDNGRQPTAAELPHFWIAVTTEFEGVRPIGLAGPTNGMPELTIMGRNSPWEREHRKVAIFADLDLGAAAYLPQGAARYEEGALALS